MSTDVVEATVWKETRETKTGITFASKNGAVVISGIDPNVQFQGTPLQVGSEVVSIDGIPCSGCRSEDCAEMIHQTEGYVKVISRKSRTSGGGPNEEAMEHGEMEPLADENSESSSDSDLASDGSNLFEYQLTEDVYSLFFTSRYHSPGFRYALLVFAFQISIIALVLWDLLDHFNQENNPLNVPPGATPQVQAAMALALLLAVATQEDLIVAVTLLQQGYSPHVMEQNPSATRSKWLISCLSQFVAGASLLLTIFILVVQSSTVIQMMLNFAALSFIADIDDVAFALAKKGFVTDTLEREANHVCELKIPARKKSNTLRRVLFFMVLGGLMAGYGIIIHQQRSGKFLCQSVYLQLGDGFDPRPPFFSGIYDQTDSIINGRVTYMDRNSNQAMLGYCEEEDAWTLTAWDLETDPQFVENPCEWFLRSPQTETFDITTTSNTAWLIDRLNGTRVSQLQTFLLTCADCGGNSARSGSCGGDNGQCVNNNCVCDPGWYGTSCEFEEPCASLAVDARTNGFSFGIANEYDLLLDNDGSLVEVYGRPVYAFSHEREYWSILVFSGRRWIATESRLFNFTVEGFPANATRTELIASLKEFHGFFSPILGWYASDPMDAGTPSDAFTPVGLGWNRLKDNTYDGIVFNEIDTSQSVGTSLLCAVCDEFVENNRNGCFFGVCMEGVCWCDDDHEGVLCELDVSEVGNQTFTEGT